MGTALLTSDQGGHSLRYTATMSCSLQWTVLLLLCGAETSSGASIHHILVRDPSPSLPLASDLSLSSGLKKMRAQTPASSSDFGAVIEGLSSEALGSGLVAKTILTVLKFFLSN